MNSLWFALLFFLPAGVANMMPVFANKIPLLNQWKTPLDFGKTWHGIRIFGNNKRIRGVVAGTIMGSVVGALVFPQLTPEIILSWGNYIILGGLIGFGALIGDVIESFFKRRVGVATGDSWFLFDQIDYIIGGLLASLLLVRLSFITYVLIFVLYFGLHLAVSYIGYVLKLKNKPI